MKPILIFLLFMIGSITSFGTGKSTTVCTMDAKNIDVNYELCCSSNTYQLYLYTGKGNLMECCYENKKEKWNYQFGRYCSKHFENQCSCGKNVKSRIK